MSEKIQITIVVENGQVMVNAPFHDKITCLGLLEMAKIIVVRYQKPEQKVIVPTFIPPKMEGH